MTLPIYHLIQLEADYFEKLQSILSPNLNTHQPIVFDAKKLDIDQQRELIGIVENYFSSNSLSHRFPYPIYILSDLEKSISRIILVKEKSSLPKFFNQKGANINIKESHYISRNELLQQEIKNGDAIQNEDELLAFAQIHKKINHLEEERLIYSSIEKKLNKR
jgi:hypothetical protein